MRMNRLATLFVVIALSLLISQTALAEPSPPSDIQALAGRDYVDLWWKTVPDAEHYLLYRGDGEDMALLANVTAPITAYHDGDLVRGSSFIYYVTAVQEGNESAPSSSVSVTVPPKSSESVMLPVLAIVLSAIALQIGAIVLLYLFKSKMRMQ
jgi:hypothetical protein